MGKSKNNKKERLPFQIAKDSQNLLRVKVKELSAGVTERYSKMPKRMWSSLVIVLGIFAIVLIALFAGGPTAQKNPITSADDDSPLSSLTDIVIDENGKFRAQVPELPHVSLNGEGLNLEAITDEHTDDEEATSAAKILTNPEVVEGTQPVKFTAIYPLRRQGAVITKYGWYLHPILDVWRFHQGIDIRCKKGDLVMAVAPGKVSDVTESDQEVIMITVDHGNGWISRYGQVEEVKVKVGDQISKGQELGVIGQSAFAIEPHLHFEIRNNDEAVDPVTCLK